MRILFVTANRLGDAVLSTGLLDHLIRTYPEARITVACGPVAEGVFQRMPNLERIVVIAKQPFGRHWLPLWGMTVTRRWDLVVDIRGSALSWLVPTRRRAVMRPRFRAQDRATRAGTGLAAGAVAGGLVFGRGRRARCRVCSRPAGPVIALAPTANWAPKVWPAERFVALFQRLATEPFPGRGPGGDRRSRGDRSGDGGTRAARIA